MQKQLAFAGQEDTVFSGEITAISVSENGYATYLLDGTFQNTVPARVKYFCDVPDYAFGDTLTVTGIPQTLESTYVFDAADYYRAQRILLSMPMDSLVEHTPRNGETLRSMLYEWRLTMTERIRADRSEESGALMTGMLFGDKSAMSDSTKTSLYRTGIGHVLAVSGLHLDFLALLVISILRKLKMDRRLSFLVLAGLALLFVICVGETVSVKRACIMILISQSAGLFFRKADTLNTISIAMLLLTVENPFVIHSAAFWLSFSGTFGIAVFAPYMTQNLKTETFLQKQWKNMLAMCCVFLAVLPAGMLYFREISLISPLTNLLIVPLCMAVLLLETLALVTGASGVLSELLLGMADSLSSFVLQCSDLLARLPWTHTQTDSEIVPVLIVLSVLLILVCYLCWQSRRTLCTAIAVSLTALCIASGLERNFQNQNLHITVLGEKRDCVLVLRHGSEAVIIDMSGDSQAADYVNAYMQSSGIRQVTSLFLGQPNPKNCAGYNEILDLSAPGSVVSLKPPETEDQSLVISGTEAIYSPNREILFHGALVAVSEGCAEISCNTFRYVCCKEKTPDVPACEVLTVYGTSKNVLPDCGLMIVLDDRSCYTENEYTYIGKNNLELTVTETGKCRVRSLYADY